MVVFLNYVPRAPEVRKVRPPRRVTKQRNRALRSARWELTHAAGCVWDRCATAEVVRDPEWAEGLPGRVSVPRSLRPLLGRWAGGAS